MIELLIVFMWVFIILLAFIWIGDDVKKLLSRIKGAKIGDVEFKLINDVLNPYEHIFFYNLKRYLKYEDNYPICEVSAKNVIITNMIRIKLECWYKNYFNFFGLNQKIDFHSMNELIEKIIKEYEEKWTKAKIPQYIIDSFNTKHKNKVDYMTTEMKYLFNQHSIDNTDDKFFTHIFLNRSFVLLDETLKDMEKTLKETTLKEEDKDYNYIYEQYIP